MPMPMPSAASPALPSPAPAPPPPPMVVVVVVGSNETLVGLSTHATLAATVNSLLLFVREDRRNGAAELSACRLLSLCFYFAPRAPARGASGSVDRGRPSLVPPSVPNASGGGGRPSIFVCSQGTNDRASMCDIYNADGKVNFEVGMKYLLCRNEKNIIRENAKRNSNRLQT